MLKGLYAFFFEKNILAIKSAKHQAPNKLQIIKFKCYREKADWILKFGAYLELGAWSLELFSNKLSIDPIGA